MATRARMKKILAHWLTGLFLALLVLPAYPAPAIAKNYLKVAILNEPKNLNPFQTTDAWARRVIQLIYQPLYLVDPGSQTLIPWLARDQPVYDTASRTVTFHLREMRWDDGTPFTSEDVVFTAEVFKKFRVPRYYAYWEPVERIDAPDKKTVRMTLRKPTAIFARRTLTSWVVQKKKWEPPVRDAEKRLQEQGVSRDAEDPGELQGEDEQSPVPQRGLKEIQAQMIDAPTGLGPFKFASREKGAYILLVKNEQFFGLGRTIAGRLLGPYIDGVMFKIYDALPAATLALKEGQVDFLWKGISHAFVKDLVHNPYISVPMTLDEGYRYLGFNLRKPPMSDLDFRRAVAYLINKNFIVKRILHDHGQRLDTFIPPSNTIYYNPNTAAYGKGMDRKRRVQEAYSILTSKGYRWQVPPLNARGLLQKGDGLILPDGRALPHLTLITPPAQYDTEMAASGQAIQEWLREFGIPVSWDATAFSSLIRQVKLQREFDMFILSWRDLSLDPDYLRRFFHSAYDVPNQWNFTGYDSAEFDRLAELQAQTLDLKKRQQIVMQLQSLLSMDLPYIPLYVPHQMEGIRTDRFNGWVNQVGGIGNIWTFCMLKPVQE